MGTMNSPVKKHNKIICKSVSITHISLYLQGENLNTRFYDILSVIYTFLSLSISHKAYDVVYLVSYRSLEGKYIENKQLIFSFVTKFS